MHNVQCVEVNGHFDECATLRSVVQICHARRIHCQTGFMCLPAISSSSVWLRGGCFSSPVPRASSPAPSASAPVSPVSTPPALRLPPVSASSRCCSFSLRASQSETHHMHATAGAVLCGGLEATQRTNVLGRCCKKKKKKTFAFLQVLRSPTLFVEVARELLNSVFCLAFLLHDLNFFVQFRVNRLKVVH